MTTALRPLTTGELLDRTFSLYRSHFGLFIGIFALPHLAVLAFQFLGVAERSPGRQFADVMAMVGWVWGALFLQLIFGAISQAASVAAVSELYLGGSSSIFASFVRVKGRLIAVVFVTLLVTVVVVLACFALVVPGVLLALMWSLTVPCMVLENKGILDSMSRSMDLTKGNRGRVFVIWLLFFVLSIGMNWLLQWLLVMLAGMNSRGAMYYAGAGWQIASHTATFISQCLCGPLTSIAFCLVYYDERIRKEAFDIHFMMSMLDAQSLPSSTVQVGA